jgi:hypothetical protein
LCKKLTLIGYLCEICSMCENMAVSELSAVSEVLCSVPDRHYTESGNSSVSNKDKGRHAYQTRVSYLNKRETHFMGLRLLSK